MFLRKQLMGYTGRTARSGGQDLSKAGFGSKMTRLKVWGFIVLLLTATLLGCSHTKNDDTWSVTGTFDIPATAADGTPFHYTMRGAPGQYGFIDSPFVAGRGNKYMWHLWGKPEDFVGKKLEITAESRYGKTARVFSGGLAGALNGAVAHTPSTMTLPTPGPWRLDVRVGGQLIGSVVVAVKPAD